MRKYLIKILLFFAIIAVLDVLFGFACQYLNSHSKGGGTKSRYCVSKESDEDILVFGSSRAKHHYVPYIIEDRLGKSCYNTGEDGNGIIMCYGFLKMITARYNPKLIIYDVTGFDIYKDDNVKYLDLMKPYYDEPGIDSIFWTVNPKSRLIMKSNLYRYNTTCLSLLGNYIRPMQNYPKGYSALSETMDYEPNLPEMEHREVDSLKVSYFEEFIKLVKRNRIELVCCVSPYYKGFMTESFFYPVKQLCESYDVPFFFFGSEPTVSFEKELFKDRTHLNDKGARYYTNIVASIIDDYFEL